MARGIGPPVDAPVSSVPDPFRSWNPRFMNECKLFVICIELAIQARPDVQLSHDAMGDSSHLRGSGVRMVPIRFPPKLLHDLIDETEVLLDVLESCL